jgi:DNA-binding MarR family transcriptional regulator
MMESFMSQDGKRRTRDADDLGAPIDTILAQWRRERPDIDPSPMAVCGEVKRASERVRQGIVANLSGTGLDLAGFDVLLTLRRQGRGGSLSPSALAKAMMLSTSAMTSRLDRLEKRGLIERNIDPGDRRGLKIVLTDEGFALADELVVSHVETEERMLAALSEEERSQLRTLLNKISAAPHPAS